MYFDSPLIFGEHVIIIGAVALLIRKKHLMWTHGRKEGLYILGGELGRRGRADSAVLRKAEHGNELYERYLITACGQGWARTCQILRQSQGREHLCVAQFLRIIKYITIIENYREKHHQHVHLPLISLLAHPLAIFASDGFTWGCLTDIFDPPLWGLPLLHASPTPFQAWFFFLKSPSHFGTYL